MGSQIVSKVMENGTPLVSLQQYQFGNGTGVLSVRIKNDQKGPQTGDVVLDLDDAVISLLDWKADFPYVKGNVCIYGGMLHRAKVEYPTLGQFIPSEWEELDKVDILAEDFKPNFPYEKDQVCVVNHMFYRALNDFMSGPGFDIKDWEEIGGATIDDYTPGMHINRWQPIIYGEALYRAKDDFTASDEGNVPDSWALDVNKFEEILSGDSTYITKDVSFDYDETSSTLSFNKTHYQLNSRTEIHFLDEFIHDETIEITKNPLSSGIQLQIGVPIADTDKLGVIRGAKILPDPHYKGEMQDQGQMDVITNPKLGDFCDRLDTNTEWTYNGTLWVNTFEPIGTTPHEKVPDNYVQFTPEGFGFVNITEDSLLRLATDAEAKGRVNAITAVSPAHLGLYGGNFRQVETKDDLPAIGLSYDFYYVYDEDKCYIWDPVGAEYLPFNSKILTYENNTLYTQNEIVIYKGKIYKAKNTFISGDTFNEGDWIEIGNSGIPDFEPNTPYTKDSPIFYAGIIYRAKTTFTSGNSFNLNNWEPLTRNQETILAGVSTKLYVASDGEDVETAGDKATPYKTLEYAISKARDLIQATGSEITIYLKEGETFTCGDLENIKRLKISTETAPSATIALEPIIIKDSSLEFSKLVISTDGHTDNLITSIYSDVKLDSVSFESTDTDLKGISITGGSLTLYETEFDSGFNNPLETKDNGNLYITNLTIETTGTPISNDSGNAYISNPINGLLDGIAPTSNLTNLYGYYNKDRIENFEQSTHYIKHAQVTYHGLQFRAKETFTSGTEFDSNDWDLVEYSFEDFKPSNFYLKGELMRYQNGIYQSKEDFTSGTSFSSNDWVLLADITSVNTFQPDYDYSENQMIIYNGSIYIAKYDFTSTNYFDEDDWTLIAGQATTGLLDFKPNSEYSKFATIFYNGKIYRAKDNFTSSDTFNVSDWDLVANYSANSFEPNHYYELGEVIFHNGYLWVSNNQFTSTDTFDSGDWTTIKSTIENYQNNHYYPAGSTVIYEGNVYYTENNITTGDTFNPTEWKIIEGKPKAIVPNFEVGKDYVQNELCVYNQRIYRAKRDTTPLNWDIDAWEPIDESSVKDFVANQFYPKDALCAYEDSLYRAKDNFTTSTTFDENDWIVVSGAGASVQNYTEGIKFKENDLTVYKQRLYQAKEDFTSGTTFDITKWTPVDESAVRNFVANQFYPKDAICANNSALYRAKANFTSGATFNAADWEAISDIRIHVDPLDNTTEYLLTTQPYGSAAPTPVTGKTVICLYTEN